MPQIMAFLPLITAVAGPLLSKALGGGAGEGKERGGGGPAAQIARARAPLFAPSQIKEAQDKYSQTGTAKWNQILAGMGAGGGTGGPDVATQIGSQANQLGSALQGLTTESGYGDSPMGNLDAILKGVESGISPKYSVYS